MTRTRNISTGLAAAGLLALTLATAPLAASDHADPLLLGNLDAGITGLFVFPDPSGERLVVILTVRRGLSGKTAADIGNYEFAIHIDTDSAVEFNDDADQVRYGGTVARPEAIREDVTIRFRLRADGTRQSRYPRFEGIADVGPDNWRTGVYDDPFIFPRFFLTNVVAMAVSIPFEAFPGNPQHFLVWGTSSKDGEQIDHVGRANRTQLGRLDFLNTLHPSEHVDVITSRYQRGNKVQQALSHTMRHVLQVGGAAGLFTYVLKLRDYDIFPDVVIYTRSRDAGFPNGRRLEDDVAGLTCDFGDCVLQEVALIEQHELVVKREGHSVTLVEGSWPRVTENPQGFKSEFPYLADANPPAPAPPENEIDRCFRRFWIGFWIALVALLIVWIVWKKSRQAKRDEPFVRRRSPTPNT